MSNTHSPQQALAIHTVDKNILVSASAGAGKTTVLIDRLMKRIRQDHVSVDEILAMTFTEAAAGEMKRRLAQKLNEEYKNTGDPFLYDQITKLPGANISTIHSFCLTVIRDYSFVLRLDPKRAGNILDEGTAALYKQEAMRFVLDKAYANPPSGYIELLDHFSARPESDANVAAAIDALAKVMGSKSDPETWLNESVDAYRINGSLLHLRDDLAFYFFLSFQYVAEDLRNLLTEMRELADFPEKKQAQGEMQFASSETQLTLIFQAIQQRDYRRMRELFFRLVQHFPIASSKIKEYTECRATYKKKLTDVCKVCYTEDRFVADLNTLADRLSCLGDLTKEYIQAFARIKEENDSIDFDDMEHFALQILRHPEFDVADAYRNRFKEILVDEFQDSNDVQNTIVELMARGNNVFRVGDIKQSIYRFRNAKPQLMQGLIEDQKPDQDLVLYLPNNYRSSQSIVEFNNLIFGKLMNVSGLRSSYSKNDNVSIGTDRQNGGMPVEFHWVRKDPDPGSTSESEDNLQEDAEEEILKVIEESNSETKSDFVAIVDESSGDSVLKARHIAADILRRKAEGTFTKWRDFVILVRSHRIKSYLKEAFEEAGIPALIDVQSGFYNADSVQDLLMMLNLCVDPSEDMHWVGVLLSPFFNMDQEDIARLKLNKQRGESLHDVLKREYPEIESTLLEIRRLSLTMPLHDFIPYVMNFNDYYQTSCTHSQRTNLDLFYEKALLAESKSMSLPRFLDFIDEISDAKSSEATPISDDVDVVRVMTIHQSKGLQFPVVYFWSTKRHSVLDLTNTMMTDSELGIGLNTLWFPERYQRTNPIRLALQAKAIQEEMEEEMRILYVALTRPQNLLVVVDVDLKKIPTSLTRSTVFGMVGYSGWLRAIANEDANPLYRHFLVDGELGELRGPSEVLVSERFVGLDIEHPEETVLTPSSTEARFARDFNLRFRDTLDGKQRGTRLHKLLEQLPSMDWSEELIRSIDPECSSDEIESILAFSTTPFYQNALRGTIEKEYPFAVLDHGRMINGIIDFLVIHDQQVQLVDFKTDRGVDKETLTLRYRDQLSLYREALTLAFPTKKISTYLYSFNLKELIEVNVI